jgi:Tfp pilus assembly protein PilW
MISRRSRAGLSLIEVMIVMAVAMLILLPTVNFMLLSQRSAYKGMDRLESLASARMIIEQVQRDLKALCFDQSTGFTQARTGSREITTFPIFPATHLATLPDSARNPANLIRYTFDEDARTLIRQEFVNPLLNPPQSTITKRLGTNVASFTIQSVTMFGFTAYEIAVCCEPSPEHRRAARTVLRSSARSEFQTRLERNSSFITNRASVVTIPTPP